MGYKIAALRAMTDDELIAQHEKAKDRAQRQLLPGRARPPRDLVGAWRIERLAEALLAEPTRVIDGERATGIIEGVVESIDRVAHPAAMREAAEI